MVKGAQERGTVDSCCLQEVAGHRHTALTVPDTVTGPGRARDELALHLPRALPAPETVVLGPKEGPVGECETWCSDCPFIITKGDKM